MAASLAMGLKMLEMDTAAWAATDQDPEFLQKRVKKFPKDVTMGGYIEWKEGEAWHILFFYERASRYYPVGEFLLESPVTRRSRGTLKEYPKKDPPPLEGELAKLAAAFCTAKRYLEKEFKIPNAKPFFNHYAYKSDSGGYQVLFTPADLANEETCLGPDMLVSLGPDGTSILSASSFHKDFQRIPLHFDRAKAGSTAPVLCLETPFPAPTDFFRLLLHPELSPVSANSSAGRFRMKVGVVPRMIPWMVPQGGPNPADDAVPGKDVPLTGTEARNPKP